MKESVKVSICIPAYKQPDFLRKALDSIIEQDYKDYEVIITDDTPDDSVKGLVDEYKDKISNLNYYKNQERQGQPGNWNQAVSKARGSYIKMLHHDDWFNYPTALGEYAALLDNNPDVDFAFSGTVDRRQDGSIKQEVIMNEKDFNKLTKSPEIIFLGNNIGAPSATIYRKEVHVDYSPRLKWLVDTEQYYRVILLSRKIIYTPKTLISVLAEAAERMTAQCIGNRYIELPEYTYFYNEIKKDNRASVDIKKRIWKLFDEYNVTSINTLTSAGVNINEISEDFKSMISARKIKVSLLKIWKTFCKIFSVEGWINRVTFYLSNFLK
jgi:glycosyltransferase involved in cell wall biosynthesis